MRRAGIAGTVVLVAVTGLVAPPAHAAPTCFGKPATIVGTDRDDDLEGTPGRDVIWSGAGYDTVHGRGGNDLICGGDGEDRGLYGNKGNDWIDAGTSEREKPLYGGKGDDVLVDEPGGLDGQLMFGGPGDDQLQAGDSNGTYVDVLDGGPGNDRMEQLDSEGIFHAGPGNDVMNGGSGGGDFDELILTDAPGPIEVDMRDGTMRGWGNDEVVELEIVMGTRFGDTVFGDEDKNFLIGGAGDDTLSGGAGRDCLVGGAVVNYLRCFKAYEVAPRSGDDVLSGGDGDDELTGGDGDDRFTGDDGFDTASFGASTAPVDVDLGASTATGEGSDSIDVEAVVGSRFADTITGTDGPDLLAAGTLSSARGDVLRGLGGDDTLGAAFAGDVDGGAGNDTASYGFTFLFGDGAVTEVDLRSGSDSLGNVLVGIENVYGVGHNTMTVHGDDGPNVLTGGGGDDEIYGHGGDDHLDGSYGEDALDGGPGTDVCVEGETVSDCEG